jgi:hypothetical protein
MFASAPHMTEDSSKPTVAPQQNTDSFELDLTAAPSHAKQGVVFSQLSALEQLTGAKGHAQAHLEKNSEEAMKMKPMLFLEQHLAMHDRHNSFFELQESLDERVKKLRAVFNPPGLCSELQRIQQEHVQMDELLRPKHAIIQPYVPPPTPSVRVEDQEAEFEELRNTFRNEIAALKQEVVGVRASAASNSLKERGEMKKLDKGSSKLQWYILLVGLIGGSFLSKLGEWLMSRGS